jgi:hypothetical protein
VEHLQQLVGAQNLHRVAASGGKFLFSNLPVNGVEGVRLTRVQILGSERGLW